MPRENAAAKGRRLLAEGRLVVERVDGRVIVATVRGDSGEPPYRLGWHPRRREWACTC